MNDNEIKELNKLNDLKKMKELKKPFASLGHAILSLNPEINLIDTKRSKRQFPIERMYNAFFYFEKTERGSGLVELAYLLENMETGWLPEMLRLPRYPNVDLAHLINDARLLGIAGDDLVRALNVFRVIRNDCVHDRHVESDHIEAAFWAFLLFFEWYYMRYSSLTKLFDATHYTERIPDGKELCKKFKVVKLIGCDEHSQTYQVENSREPKGYYFTAKRVLISAPNYKDIIKNESTSRPLFNDNPNVGRFYSLHDDFPVGDVLLFEYIDGWTLKQWIEEEDKGCISSDVLYELVYIVGGVLRALQSIHSKKYVHGFVSQRSILVTRSTKDARLVSFDRCTPASTSISSSEKFLRVFDEYSPQPLGNIGKTPALDTYAVGQVLKKILVPERLKTEIHPSLQNMIDRATSDNVKKRYPTAKEMYEDWIVAHNDLRFKRVNDNPYKNVALISCSNRKLDGGPHKARDLYSASENFVKALKYVEDKKNHFDHVFIVSGRHGLVELDQTLKKYDFDLKQLSDEDRASWATFVACALEAKIRNGISEVTIFADRTYSDCLLNALERKHIKASRNPDFFPL